MKNFFFLILIFSLFSCGGNYRNNELLVSNSVELQDAISNAVAGDEIVMGNGIWKDVQILFVANGTKEKPIVLKAETAGEVFIEGTSDLKFGGEYLTVSGLFFRNGYTPSKSVIDFKISKEQVANHCRVTNCVILDYNQPMRDHKDLWVTFWGQHNMLDHCYIAGKANSGPTVRIFIEGNQNIRNFHQIVNNHFGPRPRKGGPHGETIQIGDSFSSMSPSNTQVANNLFERCNGEVEIISSKTNFNEFRNNVFYKSEGSLVMRHGNYCIIDGNIFIGDENTEQIGGIRIVNTGHTVTNNYFYNIKGENFRSALAIMNGIPKSPLNRYNQVTDVTVAYNTWINCVSPWQFSVGANISQKDVLPLSEIRSARPIRMVVANNIIYNEEGDPQPIFAHDKIDGVKFKNNIINNQGVDFEAYGGLKEKNIEMSKVGAFIYSPIINEDLKDIYPGYGFDEITKDLLGNSRTTNNAVGALCQAVTNDPMLIDKSKYGCNWFSNEKEKTEAAILEASEKIGDLQAKIAEAKNGDVIVLLPGTYNIDASLAIDKALTIKSKEADNKATIVYSGIPMSPVFEMNPKANLTLKDMILTGSMEQCAFASLKENMSSCYFLNVSGVEISNFNFVLKAYKQTFAEEITFTNCVFNNCNNGIELSEETDDKGDYNVEFLTIDKCTFKGIKKNVVDYYRGGYDESTIGGNLSVTNCAFSTCGALEENGILLNTRGIVNVDISNNTFKNNKVKLVALLWGAKNNTHSNNEILKSGKVLVQENLKLKMMY